MGGMMGVSGVLRSAKTQFLIDTFSAGGGQLVFSKALNPAFRQVAFISK